MGESRDKPRIGGLEIETGERADDDASGGSARVEHGLPAVEVSRPNRRRHLGPIDARRPRRPAKSEEHTSMTERSPAEPAGKATTPEDRRRGAWLVLRAQAGDRDALDALLRTLQQPLYRYLLSLVGSGPLAEDLLQDTFLLVYRKLRWLREPELFRPWAFRIASREAFRRLRRDRRYASPELDEERLAETPEPALEPEVRELARRLPELVSAISPGSRAVIALHYLDEMPLGEVAAVLGIALGTAKSRLAYGLTQLRRVLDTQTPVHRGQSARKENP